MRKVNDDGTALGEAMPVLHGLLPLPAAVGGGNFPHNARLRL